MRANSVQQSFVLLVCMFGLPSGQFLGRAQGPQRLNFYFQVLVGANKCISDGMAKCGLLGRTCEPRGCNDAGLYVRGASDFLGAGSACCDFWDAARVAVVVEMALVVADWSSIRVCVHTQINDRHAHTHTHIYIYIHKHAHVDMCFSYTMIHSVWTNGAAVETVSSTLPLEIRHELTHYRACLPISFFFFGLPRSVFIRD